MGENNPGILDKMAELMFGYRCDIFAPHPSEFNGQIVNYKSFDRKPWADSAGSLLRGPKADGVILPPNDMAFAVSSADCPTIVLTDRRTGAMVAAHAGLDSLIDRSVAHGGEPSREHASVVDAMVAKIRRFNTSTMQAFVTCGISPEAYYFDKFGEHGERNKELLSYVMKNWGAACYDWVGRESGGISLFELIRAQLALRGVRVSTIGSDGACTFYDKKWMTDEYLWHSNRRGDKTRNLVLVIRRK